MRSPLRFAPRLALFTCLASSVGACVPPQQGPADPSPASSAGATAPGVATSDGPAPAGPMAPVKPETPRPGVPTTIEVHSMCAQTVPRLYGEKPKYGSGTKSSISSNSTQSVPRWGDGTLVVWLIDEQENGLASVHITPRMTRVDIGPSCRTLDAH